MKIKKIIEITAGEEFGYVMSGDMIFHGSINGLWKMDTITTQNSQNVHWIESIRMEITNRIIADGLMQRHRQIIKGRVRNGKNEN